MNLTFAPLLLALLAPLSAEGPKTAQKEATVAYLQSLQQPDGGFLETLLYQAMTARQLEKPAVARRHLARAEAAYAKRKFKDWSEILRSDLLLREARAVVNRPAVILADEPTGELDTATGHDIVALLKHLVTTEGLTLVVATHDPAVAWTNIIIALILVPSPRGRERKQTAYPQV